MFYIIHTSQKLSPSKVCIWLTPPPTPHPEMRGDPSQHQCMLPEEYTSEVDSSSSWHNTYQVFKKKKCYKPFLSSKCGSRSVCRLVKLHWRWMWTSGRSRTTMSSSRKVARRKHRRFKLEATATCKVHIRFFMTVKVIDYYSLLGTCFA